MRLSKMIRYGLDHQGTTVLVTDETGQAVWSAESSPFCDHVMGGIKIREDLKLKYTGKDYDEDTDLYYFNARWHDASTGRFITEDSARYGQNWYAYTFNNPLKYIDPTGLSNVENEIDNQGKSSDRYPQAEPDEGDPEAGDGNAGGDNDPKKKKSLGQRLKEWIVRHSFRGLKGQGLSSQQVDDYFDMVILRSKMNHILRNGIRQYGFKGARDRYTNLANQLEEKQFESVRNTALSRLGQPYVERENDCDFWGNNTLQSSGVPDGDNPIKSLREQQSVLFGSH